MAEEHEDVDTTLEQSTTPDTSQQMEKSRAIGWIVGVTFVFVLLLIIGWGFAQAIGWNPDISSEHFAQFYFAWGLGILSLGYLVLILWSIFKKDEDPRWFHARILSSGIVGGSYAFLLPVVMSLPEGSVNSGGAAALRQAILLATGGLIGLIALGETRRKNDNDREAAENLRIHQQDTLDQQKEQFEKQLEKQQEQFDANAFKERKAERRERYTKAVEQLGDEKAPIRMGGVYTLVGLVDEWLEEKSLSDDERFKEGQVIINNLCAYIRSPFTLATRYDELSKDSPSSDGIYKDNQQEFYTDKAEFKAEADVRLGIIKEIHDRIQGPDKDTPGAWSDFEYDFSGSTFFYPIDLTNSYYAKPINFSGSTYEGGANFSDSIYQWADFSRSVYQWADFSRSTYEGGADFSRSTYEGGAFFSDSTYEGGAFFSRSTYEGGADFTDSIYQWADFTDSTYKDVAYFTGSTYDGGAYFSRSTYKGEAYFSRSTYKDKAYFSGSTYKDEANFSGSTYQGSANFSGSTYKAETKFNDSFYESSVDFSNSTYYDRVEFHGYNLGSGYECLTYEGTANFSHSVYLGTPVFGPSTYKSEAIFSNSIYSEPVNFSSSNTYKYKVDFSSSTYHGKVSIGASAYESQSNFRDSLYAEGADFTFAAFKGSHYFDGSVFYKALDLHGSVSYKEEPIFTHDYPTYTDPRPEYDKINRHITLFPAVGNDFTITLQGNQDPLDIPNLLKYCDFLDSLIPEKIEDYNQIINEIIITRDNFKSTQNIQEKDKYAEIFKEKNKELYKWREEVTTIVLQNGVEVSD